MQYVKLCISYFELILIRQSYDILAKRGLFLLKASEFSVLCIFGLGCSASALHATTARGNLLSFQTVWWIEGIQSPDEWLDWLAFGVLYSPGIYLHIFCIPYGNFANWKVIYICWTHFVPYNDGILLCYMLSKKTWQKPSHSHRSEAMNYSITNYIQ